MDTALVQAKSVAEHATTKEPVIKQELIAAVHGQNKRHRKILTKRISLKAVMQKETKVATFNQAQRKPLKNQDNASPVKENGRIRQAWNVQPKANPAMNVVRWVILPVPNFVKRQPVQRSRVMQR